LNDRHGRPSLLHRLRASRPARRAEHGGADSPRLHRGADPEHQARLPHPLPHEAGVAGGDRAGSRGDPGRPQRGAPPSLRGGLPARSDAPMTRAVGLIDGNGIFPILFARSARASGYRVVAVAHEGETDPAIEQHCDSVTWVKLGQLGKIVRAFEKEGVREAAMAGGIAKVRVFGGIWPDLLALKHMSKVRNWGNDDLLRTIAGVFEEEGVTIIDPARVCPEIVAREGCYTRRRPSEELWEDIRLGYRVATAVSEADIGQTVCVKRGNV